jgi:hypothetical protein
MNKSLSVNILRLSLLLVLVGFFLPIGCNSNGYQLAQGILGNTQQAGNAIVLGSIEDSYGYLLFGVFVFAFLGLLFTFLSKTNNISSIGGSIVLAVSFVLLTIVVLKLRSFLNSGVVHLVLTIIPMELKILIGGYSMVIGYLVGLVGFVLKTFKIIE